MTAAYFEDHPTDPDKVILRKKARVEEDDDIQVYQRPWVGLTDEEVERLIHNFGPDPWTLLDEVEARLKARNT